MRPPSVDNAQIHPISAPFYIGVVYSMNKIKTFIQEHHVMALITIALLILFALHREWFFLILLAYVYLIRLLLSNLVKDNVRKILNIIIWTTVIVLSGIIFYVHHYMPKGPLVGTGDFECAYDGRGPCGEAQVEDMSKLNIPSWAKFFKSSAGLLLIFALLFLAGANKHGEDEKGEEKIRENYEVN